MTLFDCRTAEGRAAGLAAAVDTIRAGRLIVLPTDTVYGIGADAFAPAAVRDLLAAKGRGRHMPPPVLVGDAAQLADLAPDAPPVAADLAAAYWPGGLTVIVSHAPELAWDLGDTGGTVGVRMPDDPVAVELLRRTGPLAVSSANLTGTPPAATAADAVEAFGTAVGTYLETGPCPGGVPSTVVSLVGDRPRLIRAGAVPARALRTLLPDLVESSTAAR
ncbi:L-threonylcarbamoyladenylate synthase [Actinocatenispora rupis]|uniref:L-threonylcarbamoyladenylate synthase n=1 Tax=Actinocatenispora rupis TaxID=519421 RepID=A0A8J3J1D4_9ACTN|nr:L-threonylcarbamoyladenylate synthase [Actinocatenispora rupis]GID12765.1 threonylcarbamoyl-AMP synthase [Actinocatenispora rupis]